jgi:hypothetical protein
MATETVSSSEDTLSNLAAAKAEGYTKLFAAAHAVKAAWREVAHHESLCAAYLVAAGHKDEAVHNLNAEANALVQSGEYVEAFNIYKRIAEMSSNTRLQTAALQAAAQLSGVVNSLKNEKNLLDVLQLVEKLGGTMLGSADGAPGATRFCQFSLDGVNFRVDISTIYQVTVADFEDMDTFDVATIDRLETRVLEVVQKTSVIRDAESSYDDDDDEEDDDDFDVDE